MTDIVKTVWAESFVSARAASSLTAWGASAPHQEVLVRPRRPHAAGRVPPLSLPLKRFSITSIRRAAMVSTGTPEVSTTAEARA